MGAGVGQDKADLSPGRFPADLEWTQADAAASLEKLYEFAVGECDRAIRWYLAAKNTKRLVGWTFRLGALVTFTLAGIIPIVCEIYSERKISPAWATLALAVSAFLIAGDKLGGHTSGWVRYIQTGQRLTRLQTNFQAQWEQQRARLATGPLDTAAIARGIERCRSFLSKVHEAIRAETDQWAREFQKALAEVEAQAAKKGP
jgi:SMODS and SLOG-associating 2TM effector domain 2